MSRVLIPKCPLWKFLQRPSRHQTLVSDFSVLVLPLSRRGAQKTHGPWFDFSLGTPPNRLSQQMMWPWIYLRRAFSLCLLSHVYGLVHSSWSSSLSWIDGPAFGESSPSPVLALVSSAARPHSSTRFGVMFGLQPKTSSISSKYSKVEFHLMPCSPPHFSSSTPSSRVRPLIEWYPDELICDEGTSGMCQMSRQRRPFWISAIAWNLLGNWVDGIN